MKIRIKDSKALRDSIEIWKKKINDIDFDLTQKGVASIANSLLERKEEIANSTGFAGLRDIVREQVGKFDTPKSREILAKVDEFDRMYQRDPKPGSRNDYWMWDKLIKYVYNILLKASGHGLHSDKHKAEDAVQIVELDGEEIPFKKGEKVTFAEEVYYSDLGQDAIVYPNGDFPESDEEEKKLAEKNGLRVDKDGSITIPKGTESVYLGKDENYMPMFKIGELELIMEDEEGLKFFRNEKVEDASLKDYDHLDSELAELHRLLSEAHNLLIEANDLANDLESEDKIESDLVYEIEDAEAKLSELDFEEVEELVEKYGVKGEDDEGYDGEAADYEV